MISLWTLQSPYNGLVPNSLRDFPVSSDILQDATSFFENFFLVEKRFIKSRRFTEVLSKIEFKELLSLAAKGSYFVFHGQLYKHVDGSPLGPTMANAFLVYFERNWLQNFSSYFKQYYYRRYVDDIFVLFSLLEHLESFLNFLKGLQGSMSFTIE